MYTRHRPALSSSSSTMNALSSVFLLLPSMCRDSESLRAGRSGDRISVRARFSALVNTGPGAQPVSSTMVTGSFPGGVMRPGRGVDHPPPFSAEVKERIELYFYSPSVPSWCALGGTLTNCRLRPTWCTGTLTFKADSGVRVGHEQT
jgi:hypothetical protein